MELLGDVGHVDLVSIRLEILIVLVQDRCMVCAERTIGSKNVLTHLMELVESCFGPFGDSVSVCARQVHYWRQTYS